MTVLDLDDVASWPPLLRKHLDDAYPVFSGWEQRSGSVRAETYDAAYYALWDALQPYSLRGWHCTRLTDYEIATIEHAGMHLPDEGALAERIDSLVAAGTISGEIAEALKEDNESGDPFRAGMIHFMFYPPHYAGEVGIGRFFAHWGGEALYNSHEDNPATSAVLSRIGTPCVIEANVPISLQKSTGGTVDCVVRRHLAAKGLQASQSAQLEAAVLNPLPAANIIAIHRYPSESFMRLTGAAEWQAPIRL